MYRIFLYRWEKIFNKAWQTSNKLWLWEKAVKLPHLCWAVMVQFHLVLEREQTTDWKQIQIYKDLCTCSSGADWARRLLCETHHWTAPLAYLPRFVRYCAAATVTSSSSSSCSTPPLLWTASVLCSCPSFCSRTLLLVKTRRDFPRRSGIKTLLCRWNSKIYKYIMLHWFIMMMWFKLASTRVYS